MTRKNEDFTNGLENGNGQSNTQGLNGRLVFAITAAALGSAFQHGYNTGVVNAPETIIEDWISNVTSRRSNTTTRQSQVTLIWSISVSIYCVGGMIGGCLTGIIADKLGRKSGLLFNNVLVIIASALQGFAKIADSYEMIIVGRFIIGMNSGLNGGLVPIYLSEISPVRLRGAVGSVYQLVITISIVVSEIMGLKDVLGTEDLWPLLLAITLVPAMFQMITLPFCPESPKFLLVSQGNEIKAEKALTWLRNTIEVQDEMDQMRTEHEKLLSMPKVAFKDLFINEQLRMPLIVAVTVMIGQQFSGINAVVFYSTKIFNLANLKHYQAQFATLSMGTVNVLITALSLIVVEKAGRKTLLLIGFLGMVIVDVLLIICLAYAEANHTVSYLNIALILLFVIMFAIGPGSIPWFLVSELFNQSARPLATSIAVSVNWAANFVVGLAFLPLQEIMKGYVFIIFIALLIMFVVFVWKKVPETKNKTVEEIVAMFNQDTND